VKSTTTGTLAIVALAAIGTLILVSSRSLAVEAAYPVENAKRTFVTRCWSRVRGCFQGAAAAAENRALKREVAALALLRTDVERLETENARLRRALEYKAARPECWLAAGVLSADGGAAAAVGTLRVDRGSLDGVKEGAVVAVPEGLVGKVVSVTPHTAVVALPTDPSLKISCDVEGLGAERTSGILCGGSENLLVLRHLSGAKEVPARSRVLTSGRGGVFPKGIEVGTLLGIRPDAKGLASEGEVLPQVDYSTLEDVFIRREK